MFSIWECFSLSRFFALAVLGILGGCNRPVTYSGSLAERESQALEHYRKYPVKGGFHIPFYEGTTEAPFGFYFFVPETYFESENSIPVLFFFHGAGERGDGGNGSNGLAKAISLGPGRLIADQAWNPREQLLVVSPQTGGRYWGKHEIKEMLDYLKATFRIDSTRIYMTGVSMGAYGIYNYLGDYGNRSGVAAAVPICGGLFFTQSLNRAGLVKNLASSPTWAFHGASDDLVSCSKSIAIIETIRNSFPMQDARVTIYPGIGHDSWTMTYDLSGLGKGDSAYDPYDVNIFDWLLDQRRN